MITEIYPPKQHPPTRLQLHLILLGVYAIWGSAHLVNQTMVQQMPPLYMASIRYLSAGLILFTYTRLTGSPRPSRQHWQSAGIIGFLLLTVANGTLVLALRYLPTSITALLGGSLPIFILMLNWVGFSRERPSGLPLFGLSLGLVGIYLLISPGAAITQSFVKQNTLGIVLVLLSNLSWAFGVLLTPRLPLPNQLLACSMQMLVGGGCLLLCSLAFEQTTLLTILSAPATSVWSMVYLIFVGSLIGYTSYLWLARNASPTLIASFGFMGPLVAVLLGVTVAGEVLSLSAIAGGVYALVGSYLLQRKEHSTH